MKDFSSLNSPLYFAPGKLLLRLSWLCTLICRFSRRRGRCSWGCGRGRCSRRCCRSRCWCWRRCAWLWSCAGLARCRGLTIGIWLAWTHWHSTGACAHRTLRRLRTHWRLSYIEELNIKDKVRLGWNTRMRLGIGAGHSAQTITKLPGNKNAALASDVHSLKTLIEAGDGATLTLYELNGLARFFLGLAICVELGLAVFPNHRSLRVVVRGIKLGSIGGQIA